MTAPFHAYEPQLDFQPLISDIVIIGGGFAGSLAALTLGRQGHTCIVVDLNDPYPDDFRAERFTPEQIVLLTDLEVLDCFDHDLQQTGLRYDALVNALRRRWPETVRFIHGKAQGLRTSASRQIVTLADGAVLDSRLILLATGPDEKLRSDLGLQKFTFSVEHSVSIGFTLRTTAPEGFGPAMTVHGEKAGDGIGHASLFPLAGLPNRLRVNLFLYDQRNSERVRRFRYQPVEALFQALPRLKSRLPEVTPDGPVEVRVTDLYDVTAPRIPGIVLIGDARRTSCPATATGLTRILTDVKDLKRTFAPRWLGGGDLHAQVMAGFYSEDSRRKLDIALHRRSRDARRMALNTDPYWRFRRVCVRLNAWLQDSGTPPTRPEPVRFFTGDEVRVRRASEILATLDKAGTLDGLPFMPEMVTLIGRQIRVHHRADRTCVEGYGLRKLTDTVFLEAARCNGGAHDNCQRGCLMFWKEAWLCPADALLSHTDDLKERVALKKLQALTTRRNGAYVCQSTHLNAATRPLSKMHVGALLNEVREGEMPVRAFIRLAARAFINKLRVRLGLAEMGMVTGRAGEKSRGVLNLKPGDWVRIRDIESIRATVGPRGRNRGLSFEPEMTRYIGQVRQVDQVVERIIHEETGRMVSLGQTVTLRDLHCQGHCAKACPRANPLFWREIWLERVDASTAIKDG